MKKRNLINGVIMISSVAPLLLPLQAFAGSWGGDIQFDDSSKQTAHFKSSTYAYHYGKNNKLRLVGYNGISYYSPVNNKTNLAYSDLLENEKDGVSGSKMMPESKALLVKNNLDETLNINFKLGTVPMNDNSYKKLQKNKGMYNEKGWAKGKKGEWRYLGYSDKGNVVNNPFFPADFPTINSNKYPWSGKPERYAYHPWDTNPLIEKTLFDYDASASFRKKENIIKNVVFKKYPVMENIARNGIKMRIGQVICETLSVRSKPSTNSTVIDLLDRNRQFEILGTSGDFYKVRISSNGDTEEGYLSKNSNYTKELPKSKTPEEWWANRLSLQTDPYLVTPVFKLSSDQNFYRTLVVPDYPQFANLSVTKMVVYDSKNNALAEFTRSKDGDIPNIMGHVFNNSKLIKGEKYTVKYTVYNTTDKATTINPSILNYSNAYGNQAGSNDHLENSHMPGADGLGTVSQSGVINGKQEKTFSKTFTIPTSANGKFRFGGYISDIYAEKKENIEQIDDEGRVVMDMFTGDLVADGCRLYDVTLGKFVDHAIPGHKFKIYYDMTFKGGEFSKDSGQKITIHANINKALPKYKTDSTGMKTYTKTVYSLKDGQKISIEGDTFVAPVDKIDTTFQIDSGLHNLGLDANLQNDSAKASWKGNYDMTVDTVQVLPPTEIIDQKGNYNFTIKYNLNNNAPSYANPYDRDVKVTYTVNNQKFEDTVHVERGTNKNITKQVNIPIDPNTTNRINATVHVNSDGYNYEDNYNNNTGSGSNTLKRSSDPKQFACPAGVNTHNNWTQVYNVHSWNGTNDNFENWSEKKTESFKNYTSASTKTENRAENENYSIKSVKFRSKYTKDKKLGADGWVEIGTGETGKIKAGYGFELQVQVNYNTNALTYDRNLSSWVSGMYGQTVNSINGKPNLPSDLYVKTSDGKVISLSGIFGTNAGLNVTKSGNENNMTWTYTIKPKNTTGNKNDNKIYVGENVKDGVYPLEIYTPEVYGVQTKPNQSWLCDHKTVNVEVVGSDTGDINTHITQ